MTAFLINMCSKPADSISQKKADITGLKNLDISAFLLNYQLIQTHIIKFNGSQYGSPKNSLEIWGYINEILI